MSKPDPKLELIKVSELVYGYLKKWEEKVVKLAESIPTGNVITSRSFAEKMGMSYDRFMKNAKGSTLDKYKFLKGSALYWGNSETIKQLHEQID